MIYRRVISIVAAILAGLTLYSQPVTGPSHDCSKWAATQFSRGHVPPFSFEYGGVPSSKFIKGWRYATSTMDTGRPGESLRSYRWTDSKTGLQVECQVKAFEDFDATEWVLLMRNTSSKDTPAISKVRTADFCQTGDPSSDDWRIFYADGPFFGRADFCARDTVFDAGGRLMLIPDQGRSSSHVMPYFNVKTPSGGIVVSVGWTGSWRADITRPSADRFRIEAGLNHFDSYLKPGEEIRMASVALIPWQGEDRMDGQNIFRRFILAHHHPEASGKPVRVPLLSDFGGPGPWPCDENACLTDHLAQAYVKQIRFLGTQTDGFWLDAGWYSRAGDWQKKYWWHSAVGNWTADPKRFPDGLAPLADLIHEDGGKFLLWFEPERANIDSDWAHEHPEWMLAESGEPAVPVTEVVDSAFIVNLGNPQALEWVKSEMLNKLTEYKVDIYRQDFNIDPEKFWLNNDEPGRRGMCEAKYINGLYSYLDFLHEQLPFLVMDNCAGGGRRLDVEMLSRGISLWRSDYSIEVEGKQCHSYSLNQWIPIHCINTGSPNPYDHRSALGPGGNVTFGVYNYKQASMEEQHKLIDLFREVGPYYLEDYYPLSGYGDLTGDDIWLAYQLHRPSDDSGIVLAFRRKKCEENSYTVQLRGLDPDRRYRLEYDRGEQPAAEFTGRELAEGLTLTLNKPRKSLLIRYKADPWDEMQDVLSRIVPPTFKDKNYLITDYHRKGDSLYTAAIQKAVDKCSAAGGGHVIIPAGRWETGPIRLKSGVDLHLEDGATLAFTTDVRLFDIVHTHWEGIDCYNVQPLIYADNAENIAITGNGLIDGQASHDNWYGPTTAGIMQADGSWLKARDVLYQWCAYETPLAQRRLSHENPARTQTINLMSCRNILLEGFTINRSPFWCIHPVLCSNVTMRGVTMDSHLGNNDGVDPESTTDMLIENCVFDTGDDCIAIKSGRDADGRRLGVPSSNIIVRNCKMRDGHAGVAIGSEISGGFKNLWVENCEMDSPNLDRIIRVKSNPRRGGTVSNLNARNLTVGECDLAILGIELTYAKVKDGPYPLDFRDITIENVTSSKSRFVVHVDGSDETVGVHGITLRNCNIDGVTEPELCHIVGAENVRFENVTVNGEPFMR